MNKTTLLRRLKAQRSLAQKRVERAAKEKELKKRAAKKKADSRDTHQNLIDLQVSLPQLVLVTG